MPAFHLKADTVEAVQWMKPGDHANVHQYTHSPGNIDYRLFATRPCCIVLIKRGDWIVKFADGKTDVFSHMTFKARFAGTEWMPDDVEKMPQPSPDRLPLPQAFSARSTLTPPSVEALNAHTTATAPADDAAAAAAPDMADIYRLMNGGGVLRAISTDAQKWTHAFKALYPVSPLDDTMVSWFANAIEAGRAAGYKAGLDVGKYVVAEDRGWPDKDKPGVPLDPCSSRYHILRSNFSGKVTTSFWDADKQLWKRDATDNHNVSTDAAAAHITYIGISPVLPKVVPPAPAWGDAPNALTSPGEETVIIDGPIMRRVVKQATDNVLAILKAEKETEQAAPAAEEAEPTPRNVVIIVSQSTGIRGGLPYRPITQIWVQDDEPSGLEPFPAIRAMLGGHGRAFYLLRDAFNWLKESNSQPDIVFTIVNGAEQR